MRPPRHTFALVAVLGGLAVGLVLAEVLVRVFFSDRIKSTWLEMPERGYIVNQAHVTALHTWNDRSLRYRFSGQRTRGDEPDALPGKKVFAFGDSFTFGLLVEENQTFIAHLNSKLSSVQGQETWQIVNAGVGGSGFADWVAYLEEEGGSLSIDAIWIVHNYDDFARMLAKNLYVIEGDSLVESRRWRQTRFKTVLDASSLWRFMQENSVLCSLLQDYFWNRFYFVDEVGVQSYSDAYAVQLATALYDRLVVVSERFQVPLFVSSSGFVTPDRVKGVNAAVFRALPGILADRGIPAIDITPHLLQQGGGSLESFVIPGDTHPNEVATAQMAALYWRLLFAPDIFPSFLVTR